MLLQAYMNLWASRYMSMWANSMSNIASMGQQQPQQYQGGNADMLMMMMLWMTMMKNMESKPSNPWPPANWPPAPSWPSQPEQTKPSTKDPWKPETTTSAPSPWDKPLGNPWDSVKNSNPWDSVKGGDNSKGSDPWESIKNGGSNPWDQPQKSRDPWADIKAGSKPGWSQQQQWGGGQSSGQIVGNPWDPLYSDKRKSNPDNGLDLSNPQYASMMKYMLEMMKNYMDNMTTTTPAPGKVDDCPKCHVLVSINNSNASPRHNQSQSTSYGVKKRSKEKSIESVPEGEAAPVEGEAPIDDGLAAGSPPTEETTFRDNDFVDDGRGQQHSDYNKQYQYLPRRRKGGHRHGSNRVGSGQKILPHEPYSGIRYALPSNIQQALFRPMGGAAFPSQPLPSIPIGQQQQFPRPIYPVQRQVPGRPPMVPQAFPMINIARPDQTRLATIPGLPLPQNGALLVPRGQFQPTSTILGQQLKQFRPDIPLPSMDAQTQLLRPELPLHNHIERSGEGQRELQSTVEDIIYVPVPSNEPQYEIIENLDAENVIEHHESKQPKKESSHSEVKLPLQFNQTKNLTPLEYRPQTINQKLAHGRQPTSPKVPLEYRGRTEVNDQILTSTSNPIKSSFQDSERPEDQTSAYYYEEQGQTEYSSTNSEDELGSTTTPQPTTTTTTETLSNIEPNFRHSEFQANKSELSETSEDYPKADKRSDSPTSWSTEISSDEPGISFRSNLLSQKNGPQQPTGGRQDLNPVFTEEMVKTIDKETGLNFRQKVGLNSDPNVRRNVNARSIRTTTETVQATQPTQSTRSSSSRLDS